MGVESRFPYNQIVCISLFGFIALCNHLMQSFWRNAQDLILKFLERMHMIVYFVPYIGQMVENERKIINYSDQVSKIFVSIVCQCQRAMESLVV